MTFWSTDPNAKQNKDISQSVRKALTSSDSELFKYVQHVLDMKIEKKRKWLLKNPYRNINDTPDYTK